MCDGPRLVLVEDDPEIRALLAGYLEGEGFRVACADGGAALDRLLAQGAAPAGMAGAMPDLVVLDWMLPGEDGLAILRRLRAAGGPPIIMLTAKDEDIDRVLGLEMGADDYVAKPFSPRVLLARIRAVLRRTRGDARTEGEAREPAPERLRVADLVVDPGARRVTVRAPDKDGPTEDDRATGEREVALTSAEFDLLLCFVTRPQRVLSRDQLLDWTRGRVADVFDRTIDVQVSRLRRRLDEAGSTAAGALKTVRNAGYILAAPVAPA